MKEVNDAERHLNRTCEKVATVFSQTLLDFEKGLSCTGDHGEFGQPVAAAAIRGDGRIVHSMDVSSNIPFLYTLIY
jgi:hypothetical protein